MVQPRYKSLAFDDMPAPDYADVVVGLLPPAASRDPATWARSLFSLATMPKWVVGAMGIRQMLAPLIGVPIAPRDIFTVSRVQGEEALISVDDKHLNFRCAVGVDAEAQLIRVTTTVTLKGLRGRLYFAPVKLAHPVVVRAMLERSRRDLAVPIVAW